MPHIYKCVRCNIYTMEIKCPVCRSKTVRPNPLDIPLKETFNKYRLKLKASD